MAAPYPTVNAYLARLPAGVDSHPDVVVKASLLRALLGHPAFERIRADAQLPPPAHQILVTPPTATSWLPVAHFNVLLAAMYDVAYRDIGGWPAYEVWTAEQYRLLLMTPLYRVLFAVMGPERLLASAASRWGLFRKGTHLAVVRQQVHAVDLRLTFPANLEPPCGLHSLSGAFRAAIRAAGADATVVEWTVESASAAAWHIEWG
jgi:hypothetical protein